MKEKECLGWGSSCSDLTWVTDNARLKDRPKWASRNLEIFFPSFLFDLLFIYCHKILPSSHLVTLNSEAMGNNRRGLFEPSQALGCRILLFPCWPSGPCPVKWHSFNKFRRELPLLQDFGSQTKIGREICLGRNREWRNFFLSLFPPLPFWLKTTGKMARSVQGK